MPDSPQFLLICGTSHTGKSTLAGEIGIALDWDVFSTDRMGRHPGRPWQDAPAHVIEFYEKLSSDAIYTFVLHHHENMWPGIVRLIQDRQDPFILEGSAMRPEYLGDLAIHAVCLHATSDFLRARMRHQSGYTLRARPQQVVIDKFIERSVRDNARLHTAAINQSITCIDVQNTQAVADFRDGFVKRSKAKAT